MTGRMITWWIIIADGLILLALAIIRVATWIRIVRIWIARVVKSICIITLICIRVFRILIEVITIIVVIVLSILMERVTLIRIGIMIRILIHLFQSLAFWIIIFIMVKLFMLVLNRALFIMINWNGGQVNWDLHLDHGHGTRQQIGVMIVRHRHGLRDMTDWHHGNLVWITKLLIMMNELLSKMLREDSRRRHLRDRHLCSIHIGIKVRRIVLDRHVFRIIGFFRLLWGRILLFQLLFFIMIAFFSVLLFLFVRFLFIFLLMDLFFLFFRSHLIIPNIFLKNRLKNDFPLILFTMGGFLVIGVWLLLVGWGGVDVGGA